MQPIEIDTSAVLTPKILVVDDIPANLLAMKRLLKGLNAELVMANSGNEALTLAVSEDFAMILLDVNMPEMDGFEVAEHLSSADETRNTPIIFVTAVHHDKESMLRGYKAGAVDYVDKPITPAVLIAKVQVFLNMWELKFGLENEIALRRSAELEIEYQAQHDALTKLPNRRQMQKELGKLIKSANRKQEKFAVLFIDLDGFKHVNDSLGHKAGDAVLKIVAERLKSCVRDTDIVARHGGDEFIIILSDLADALALTGKLKTLVKNVSEAILLQPDENDSLEAHIGASIGVAIYPQHGDTIDTLLNSADEAMYQAKHEGKNTFRYYSTDLNESMQRRVLLDHHLHHALEKNEFELKLQPIVSIETGKPIAAEALLRWNNHKLGTVPPKEFITVAESNFCINDIGLWVFNEVLKIIKKYPQLCITMNISDKQLNNSLLTTAIETAILSNHLSSKNLEIGITENAILRDSSEVEKQMKHISSLGINFSLDDFGSGYSSLSHLKLYPIKTLKIDHLLIMGIPHNEDSVIMVAAIIAMAKALNLAVIAEGIETLEQWNFLKQNNCNFAQGCYFFEPMAIESLKAYLQ